MHSPDPFSFIIPDLQRGEVGILPTDTLYGIVGAAHKPRTVRRIYMLRRRNPSKPMIILIGDIKDLAGFGVQLRDSEKRILRRLWPGKVSVILPLASSAKDKKAFRYLHRGTNALAFRLPESARLRALLRKTGPLVAPSANLEGEPPAHTIAEAKKYFGDTVKFYIDAGRRVSKPSTLIRIENKRLIIMRNGAKKVS